MTVQEFRAALNNKYQQEYETAMDEANDRLNAEQSAAGNHFKETSSLLYRRYLDRKLAIVRDLPPEEQESAARQANAEFDAAQEAARLQFHAEMTAATKWHGVVWRMIGALWVERTSAVAHGCYDHKFSEVK